MFELKFQRRKQLHRFVENYISSNLFWFLVKIIIGPASIMFEKSKKKFCMRYNCLKHINLKLIHMHVSIMTEPNFIIFIDLDSRKTSLKNDPKYSFEI